MQAAVTAALAVLKQVKNLNLVLIVADPMLMVRLPLKIT